MPYSAVFSCRGPPDRHARTHKHWAIVPFSVQPMGAGQYKGMIWVVYAWGPYETLDAALERIPPEHRKDALDRFLNSDFNQPDLSTDSVNQ